MNDCIIVLPNCSLSQKGTETRTAETYIFDNYSLVRGVAYFSVTRRYVSRTRLWPIRRDDSSRVLIRAGGTRRSDWPERVSALDVRARSDRLYVQLVVSLSSGVEKVASKNPSVRGNPLAIGRCREGEEDWVI